MFAFYADVNAHGPVIKGLRRRGIDVKLARDDGFETTVDPEVLRRATALGRLVFTHDTDFLRIASEFQTSGEHFTGIVFIDQQIPNWAACIEDLEILARIGAPEDLNNIVKYLPLVKSS